MRILGIESSCDETGVAVIDADAHGTPRLLGASLHSQIAMHQAYGGVVPELASRDHIRRVLPLTEAALAEAQCGLESIDLIAYTRGPGLAGALLVGAGVAVSMAAGLGRPTMGVHHLEGHLLSPFLSVDPPEFPFVALLVSGGHTQIVKVIDYFYFEVLGETIDDAAGEAFDKTAKILGLPYPGGPVIQKLAETGNPERFQFSKPNIEGYNFSFSGFKTSILYAMQKEVKADPNFVDENINDICASVQKSILDILFKKLEKAAKDTGINRVAIAGGVSANKPLRDRLKANKAWETFIPKFEYTTDNAAMIGITAYHKFLKQDFTDVSVTAKARMKL